jgi:hypothetical protein
MQMLERTDIAARGPADPRGWFLFAEASRLMYADRDQYVGRPAFRAVPVAGLLDPPTSPPAPPDRRARRARAGARHARPPRRSPPATPRWSRRHHAFRGRRRARQRRVDDRDGGIDLRLGPHGRRLLPQQRTDRLQLPPRRRSGPPRRQRRRPRQAAALIHDSRHPPYPRRPLRRRDRLARRHRHPGLCRQGHHRHGRLGPVTAGRDQPPQPHRARDQL